MLKKEEFYRGNIIMVDFGKNVGSVQSGIRPAMVVQNDVGNHFAPTLIVIPLTSKQKNNMPTHYDILKNDYDFLKFDSVVICEQILTISKEQVIKKLGNLNQKDIIGVEKKVLVSMGIVA